MEYLKNTYHYKEAIKELNYSFGNYYLFEGYVIAEINEDVVYSWEEHGKIVTQDISNLYDNNGSKLIYITNRVNPYNVKPTDWLNFFKNSNSLKGYGIVSYSKASFQTAILEKLFVKCNILRFVSLSSAISWAKELTLEKAIAS